MSTPESGNSVVVKIFGEEYPISGSADVAEISRIADIVDSRMREVASESKLQARDKVAILAALSFASELSEYADIVGDPAKGRSSRLDDLMQRLDLALAD